MRWHLTADLSEQEADVIYTLIRPLSSVASLARYLIGKYEHLKEIQNHITKNLLSVSRCNLFEENENGKLERAKNM